MLNLNSTQLSFDLKKKNKKKLDQGIIMCKFTFNINKTKRKPAQAKYPSTSLLWS